MNQTHTVQPKLPLDYDLSRCADCGADRGGVIDFDRKWPFLCHACHNQRIKERSVKISYDGRKEGS